MLLFTFILTFLLSHFQIHSPASAVSHLNLPLVLYHQQKITIDLLPRPSHLLQTTYSLIFIHLLYVADSVYAVYV